VKIISKVTERCFSIRWVKAYTTWNRRSLFIFKCGEFYCRGGL